MKTFPYLLLLLLAACGRPDYPEVEPPAGFLENPTSLSQGRALFSRNCAICHGSLEEGRTIRAVTYDPQPATFRDPKYQTIDPAYLFWRIQKGKTVEPYRSRGSVMPNYGPHFTDEQIWELVAYIRSRSV